MSSLPGSALGGTPQLDAVAGSPGPPSTSARRTRTSSASFVGQVLAHEVGPDRQLAVAAVDEHGELDRARPPELGERVERGPHRAAGEEDVVDEHDGAVR